MLNPLCILVGKCICVKFIVDHCSPQVENGKLTSLVHVCLALAWLTPTLLTLCWPTTSLYHSLSVCLASCCCIYDDHVPSSTTALQFPVQYLITSGTHAAAASESFSHSMHPTMCQFLPHSTAIHAASFVTFHPLYTEWSQTHLAVPVCKV